MAKRAKIEKPVDCEGPLGCQDFEFAGGAAFRQLLKGIDSLQAYAYRISNSLSNIEGYLSRLERQEGGHPECPPSG